MFQRISGLLKVNEQSKVHINCLLFRSGCLTCQVKIIPLYALKLIVRMFIGRKKRISEKNKDLPKSQRKEVLCTSN